MLLKLSVAGTSLPTTYSVQLLKVRIQSVHMRPRASFNNKLVTVRRIIKHFNNLFGVHEFGEKTINFNNKHKLNIKLVINCQLNSSYFKNLKILLFAIDLPYKTDCNASIYLQQFNLNTFNSVTGGSSNNQCARLNNRLPPI